MRRNVRIAASAFAALLLAAASIDVPAAAKDIPSVAARKRNELTSFTDGQIADGFMKTAFGAEYHLAGRVDRIRKYHGPVRVFAIGGPARLRAQLATVVADIGRHVRHLDIAMAASAGAANVTVNLVRNRNFDRAIARAYGRRRAREIRTMLDPQCLSGFRKNERLEIQHSDIFLTTDNGDFIFHDCAYEELLQSLGPISDTDEIPWTMFNDSVQMGYFDIYDQYILNILYDPRIKAGMTVDDVRRLLPEVLKDVRPWVREVNGLPGE